MAAAGVDPSEISRRAGHSSVAFTYDRYGHLFPEVDRAGAKLDGLRAHVLSAPESGRRVSRPSESTEGMPRVHAADLHEGSGRVAREGVGSAHTRCTRCRTLHLTVFRPGRLEPAHDFVPG